MKLNLKTFEFQTFTEHLLINILSQPIAAAVLTIVPILPLSETLSKIKVNGRMQSLLIFNLFGSGISTIAFLLFEIK
jgi:hypothetical protein